MTHHIMTASYDTRGHRIALNQCSDLNRLGIILTEGLLHLHLVFGGGMIVGGACYFRVGIVVLNQAGMIVRCCDSRHLHW